MMIAGIDEAGKGPVIGPMCIGGVKIEESKAHILRVLGVADSKKLTPKKREQLAAQIKKHADGFFVLEVSPSQIDELRKIMTMNEIMVVCFSKVVEQLKPDLVYVDAADVKADRFADNLRRQYAKTSPDHAKKIEIVSMHQADAIYPTVSAASILAKVRRDEMIEELKKEWGGLWQRLSFRSQDKRIPAEMGKRTLRGVPQHCQAVLADCGKYKGRADKSREEIKKQER